MGSQRFVEQSKSWLGDMRAALEAADLDRMNQCLERLSELEVSLQQAAAEIQSATLPTGERRELLSEELAQLRALGTICARMAESEFLYLNWAQSFRHPPRAYTSEGRSSSESDRVPSWRA